MSLKTFNIILTTATVLFVFWFGVSYILTPETIAPGFGLPSWPSGDGGGFLIVKGIRDVATGLIPTVLLLTGQRRALGWVLLAEAFIPIGDMTDVLAHGGSASVAFGVHGLTAALVVLNGLLILRETRAVTRTANGAPRPATAR